METEFSRRLAPHGLTRMSYAVLGAMVFDGKTTPSGIADPLGLDRGAVTRLLDKLEGQKLIARDRDQNNMRSVSIKVTPEAKTLAKEMQEHSRAVNAHFVEALKPEDKDRFVEHVKAMLARTGTRVDRL
ncbi:MAG: MarR family transcriptional regulator [Roseobacter sp.]